MSRKYIAYLRVSTAKQGKSGLGIAAQRQEVSNYLSKIGGVQIGEYVEVESGKRNDRPQLAAALERCRLTGAVLVVAKLDRLSRNASFLLALRDSSTEFVAADLPDANTLTVGVMATLAQYERELISARTKAALKAAKARGQKLGGYRENGSKVYLYQHLGAAGAHRAAVEAAEARRGVMAELCAQGLTLRAIADRLNADSITTRRGGKWSAKTVSNCLGLLNLRRA